MRIWIAVLALFATSAPALAVDLSGAWSGKWNDTKNGHTGPLRATFRVCGTDRYHVTFSGRFFKVIPFRYSVELQVIADDGERVYLSGQQRLPFFGTFRYEAQADACHFTAQFCADRYQGEFLLDRAR